MGQASGQGMRTLCLWGALLGIILLVPHLRPAAIFLLPGILTLALPGASTKQPICVLAESIATSVAFWVIGVWVVSALGLGLEMLFWIVAPVSAFFWLIIVARKQDLPTVIPDCPIMIVAIVLALVLTVAPFILTIAPPGADMSMHGYVTRMVVEADGVPETYEPYLPIEKFGAYSIGFHTLAALIQMTSGELLQLHRAVLLMDCLVYFLFFIFLLGLLRHRFTAAVASLCACLGLFLTRSPQHFLAWGGTPTILSIGLIACALPMLKKPLSQNRSTIILSAAWLAAAFLCHPLPVIILGTIYLPYAGYSIARSMRRRSLEKLLLRYFAVIAIGVLCTAIFVSKFENRTSDDEKEWIRVWDSVVQERWNGTIWNAPITLPKHLAEYSLGLLILPLGFAMLIAAFSGDRSERTNLYFILAIAGIVVNAKYQLLPKSIYLFPDRADAMLPLFAAPLVGSLIERTKRSLEPVFGESHLKKAGIMGLLILVLFFAAGSYFYYLRPALREANVTEDDMQAFEWIRENARPDAHIANNYSDAGIFIPMMTRRSVSVPHVNIVNWSETKLKLASKPADYIYIGAKSVYPFPFEWSPSGVQTLKPRPKLVFQSGNARLYELDRSLSESISAEFLKLVAGEAEVRGRIRTLSPQQGEVVDGRHIVLEWDISGCDLFNVQLALTPNFDNPLPIYNSFPALQLADGSYDITSLAPLMPLDIPIYWRVRGLSPDGRLHQSQLRHFFKAP
ncbi:MAG: hypothetical protein JW941_06965 [Candidatus Coatesbacteria bacterium]|nr:hypothetical protein [Candidatus Coatesbacteria bacterium]